MMGFPMRCLRRSEKSQAVAAGKEITHSYYEFLVRSAWEIGP